MLGRGSFGTVYLKDRFAVKRSKATDFESLQAIVREHFVLRLNLKGCIKYHGVKSTLNIFYILEIIILFVKIYILDGKLV